MASDDEKTKRISRSYEAPSRSRHDLGPPELRTRFIALDFWQRWLLRRTIAAIESAAESLPMLGRGFMFASITINLDPTLIGQGQHKFLVSEVLPLLDEWEGELSDRN